MYSVGAHNTGHFVPLIEYGLTIQYEVEMIIMNAVKQIVKTDSHAASSLAELHQIVANAYQSKWRLMK